MKELLKGYGFEYKGDGLYEYMWSEEDGVDLPDALGIDYEFESLSVAVAPEDEEVSVTVDGDASNLDYSDFCDIMESLV